MIETRPLHVANENLHTVQYWLPVKDARQASSEPRKRIPKPNEGPRDAIYTPLLTSQLNLTM